MSTLHAEHSGFDAKSFASCFYQKAILSWAPSLGRFYTVTVHGPWSGPLQVVESSDLSGPNVEVIRTLSYVVDDVKLLFKTSGVNTLQTCCQYEGVRV